VGGCTGGCCVSSCVSSDDRPSHIGGDSLTAERLMTLAPGAHMSLPFIDYCVTNVLFSLWEACHAPTGKPCGSGTAATTSHRTARAGRRCSRRRGATEGRSPLRPALETRLSAPRGGGACRPAGARPSGETDRPAAAHLSAGDPEGTGSRGLSHWALDLSTGRSVRPRSVRRGLPSRSHRPSAPSLWVDSAAPSTRRQGTDDRRVRQWVQVDWPRVKKTPPTESLARLPR
jgi:hypothetical protein